VQGTQWKQLLRRTAADLHRELRITLTPVPRPAKWVFVVGCYNSGTELLCRILERHPGISALPQEGQFLTDQFPSDYELGLPRMWALREDLFRLTENDPGPDPVRLKKEWATRLDSSRPALLEKSPPGAARTRWLQRHFANSHFLAIVRNGYAVAEGIRRKAEPKHLKDGWPLELCARQWARSNEILLEDAAHLERVHWIRYEDLTERPAETLTATLKFLDLGSTEGLDLGTAFSVHERNEPIANLNAASIERLGAEDRAVVTRIAEPMLRHFGYEVL
jgi:Sulfotransferase family